MSTGLGKRQEFADTPHVLTTDLVFFAERDYDAGDKEKRPCGPITKLTKIFSASPTS